MDKYEILLVMLIGNILVISFNVLNITVKLTKILELLGE